MVKPTIVHKIIDFPSRTFSGLPPDVRKKKPATIIIIGTITMAAPKIKSISFSINSWKSHVFRGLQIRSPPPEGHPRHFPSSQTKPGSQGTPSQGSHTPAACINEGNKKENKIIEKIIVLR